MDADKVLSFYKQMSENNIDIWIDGGWGVDALLGEQTRQHADLDIAIQEKDVPKLRKLLTAKGYEEVVDDNTKAWNFVLKNKAGCQVDVHVISLDYNGNGIYGPKENGEMYSAHSLSGQGIIDGVFVKCIAAEDMVAFHSGYELDENDYHDVSLLCKKFGIPLPAEYKKFEKDFTP